MVHAQIGHIQTYNIYKCNILYSTPVQNNKIAGLIEFYFFIFSRDDFIGEEIGLHLIE